MTTLPLTDVSTHSMLTTFRRCPRMAMYKFHDCLRPKSLQRPLKMGKWFHSLLEAHYKRKDWQEEHQRLIQEHEEMFFEDELGDVATSCDRLMRSYLWYYQLEPRYDFKVIEAETRYETEWPDGSIYQCIIDLLVEFNGDLWLMDHKLRSQLPNHLQRLLDSQSLLQQWCLRRNGIKIRGFIWNYVRMKPPAIPRLLKNKTLSKRKIETDYVTLRRAIRNYGIDDTPYLADLQRLKALYWRPGKEQHSPFFCRESMEKDDDTIKRMATEMYQTRKRMTRYPFHNRDAVERVVDRSCTYHCSFPSLCSAELFGGNADQVRRLQYQEVDPLDYYKRTLD
jgi:PD-(D/E)XK nuclease superfamily